MIINIQVRDMEWWMLFCFTETRNCNASKVKTYLGNTRKVLQCKNTTSGRPSLATHKSYCLWHWKPSTEIFILSLRTIILLKDTDFIYIYEIHSQEVQALCFGNSLLPENFSPAFMWHSVRGSEDREVLSCHKVFIHCKLKWWKNTFLHLNLLLLMLVSAL